MENRQSRFSRSSSGGDSGGGGIPLRRSSLFFSSQVQMLSGFGGPVSLDDDPGSSSESSEEEEEEEEEEGLPSNSVGIWPPGSGISQQYSRIETDSKGIENPSAPVQPRNNEGKRPVVADNNIRQNLAKTGGEASSGKDLRGTSRTSSPSPSLSSERDHQTGMVGKESGQNLAKIGSPSKAAGKDLHQNSRMSTPSPLLSTERDRQTSTPSPSLSLERDFQIGVMEKQSYQNLEKIGGPFKAQSLRKNTPSPSLLTERGVAEKKTHQNVAKINDNDHEGRFESESSSLFEPAGNDRHQTLTRTSISSPSLLLERDSQTSVAERKGHQNLASTSDSDGDGRFPAESGRGKSSASSSRVRFSQNIKGGEGENRFSQERKSQLLTENIPQQFHPRDNEFNANVLSQANLGMTDGMERDAYLSRTSILQKASSQRNSQFYKENTNQGQLQSRTSILPKASLRRDSQFTVKNINRGEEQPRASIFPQAYSQRNSQLSMENINRGEGQSRARMFSNASLKRDIEIAVQNINQGESQSRASIFTEASPQGDSQFAMENIEQGDEKSRASKFTDASLQRDSQFGMLLNQGEGQSRASILPNASLQRDSQFSMQNIIKGEGRSGTSRYSNSQYQSDDDQAGESFKRLNRSQSSIVKDFIYNSPSMKESQSPPQSRDLYMQSEIHKRQGKANSFLDIADEQTLSWVQQGSDQRESTPSSQSSDDTDEIGTSRTKSVDQENMNPFSGVETDNAPHQVATNMENMTHLDESLRGPQRSSFIPTVQRLPSKASDLSYEGFAKANFSKPGIWPFIWTSERLKQLIQFTKEPIKKPLLHRLAKAPHKYLAVSAFTHLTSYMGDTATNEDVIYHIQQILLLGISYSDLRDEIFCQICKQTTNNPRRASNTKGWQAMALCVGTFPPSTTFRPFLEVHLEQVAGGFAGRWAGDAMSYTEEGMSNPSKAAEYCLKRFQKLSQCGPRHLPPLNAEIYAVEKMATIQVNVFLPDGSFKVNEIEPMTIAEEVSTHMVSILGLLDPKLYGIFQVLKADTTVEKMLGRNTYIMEVFSEWNKASIPNLEKDTRMISRLMSLIEKHVGMCLSASETSKGVKYFQQGDQGISGDMDPSRTQFIFKRKNFLDDAINIPRDIRERIQYFDYIQATRDVIHGVYPLDEHDAVMLGALKLRAEFGTECDMDEVFRDDIVINFGPQIYVDESEREWKNAILKVFKTLPQEAASVASCRADYLDYIQRRCPLYGSSFFFVEQKLDPRLPHEMFVAVNTKGVHFLQVRTKEALLHLNFTEICSWGYSTSTFSLVTGNMTYNQDHRLTTTQGAEIGETILMIINHTLGHLQHNDEGMSE